MMGMAGSGNLVPVDMIASLIHLVRGHRVMLDADLARLPGVATKRLNEQVKRNRARFTQGLCVPDCDLKRWARWPKVRSPGLHRAWRGDAGQRRQHPGG